ncbi:BRO family protein [Gulosibacter molinativorax]|uniref:Phage repressor protein/antirepressor Ant n=1 Tax=Gulosibacter molinativorax TaxID=256821 RepID=A0ABT7C633_9MICO|nr:BRO family protein [Gulosibacter molinativorax]MDJ1370673.1 phage repressor protein/antirepressor Ant [Gulosibacter molinativorax]QUY63300.1 Prophage antirepressor [Gulosibacter molinativorax]
MNDITPFSFESHEVRVVTIDNDVWFVAKDVAVALGYSNHSEAISRHCRGVVKRYPIQDALGRGQDVRVIAESDVMRLIVSSKLPSAVEFERKVFEEILPSVRKHGAYLTDAKIEEVLSDPDTIIRLATELKNERAANKALEVRAEAAEGTVKAIESQDGITLREFHKHYFSDVPERKFFDFLYAQGYLIDQRGARGRDDNGKLKNGKQHQHPSYIGKQWVYLHGATDEEGIRRERPRVRPGKPETNFARHLAEKGMPLNPMAARHIYKDGLF